MSRYTPREFWRWEGNPYGEIAAREGVSKRTLERWAKRFGFRRNFDGERPRYTQGPCISCGSVLPRQDLGPCTCKCWDCKVGSGP